MSGTGEQELSDNTGDSAPASIAPRLLAWYDRHRRDLPWRATTTAADPYRVWISEIMLQQTTVATVVPYFTRFMARWPTVEALAATSLDDVLHAWQGLGYYARARNLHACAQQVAKLDGGWPSTEAELRRLPGIGAYTAAAIAAIAFDRPATPVDGNILRVVARLFAIDAALPAARRSIEAAAGTLTPRRRAGDFAQAMMDLGATVCVPRPPACPRCPLRPSCAAARLGRPEAFPVLTAKPPRPTRYGVVYWLERGDGALQLRRRPASGLLGGLMEFPTTPWRETAWSDAEIAAAGPCTAEWRRLDGVVVHVFTHFRLELAVWACATGFDAASAPSGQWYRPEQLADLALPTLMRKVMRLVEQTDQAVDAHAYSS